ncbi:v-type proton atpase subunit f [Nicotiana attenuata]|uniref:V-type proton atpase subunit f n=2 Tax=Nicotiana attenuata TaxID=49451 RepID=A0A1J6J5U6_NICAT|nr:v-type proton atpase subunit f [Nicotiana attenuata]
MTETAGNSRGSPLLILFIRTYVRIYYNIINQTTPKNIHVSCDFWQVSTLELLGLSRHSQQIASAFSLFIPRFVSRDWILNLSSKLPKTLFFQMANRAPIKTSNSALIAMIADEDTITGFLLAGVGNVDLRRKTNYLIVDSKTTVKQIEDAFKEFTTREDVAIVLISQYIANMIRFLVDSYNKPIPAILEIPSKDHPYDPAHDSVLSRVKYLFSSESVASGRR